MGPWWSLMMLFFLILHWLHCSLLWRSMWYQRLLSRSSWWCHCLLWTEIEIVDNVRNIGEVHESRSDIGHSICIFLLFSQFIWELRRSRIIRSFGWQSGRSYLSPRVSLWVLLHLLIDDWVIWSVDLKLVCVVWWFRHFNILTLHLNFWCMLMRYLFFAVLGNPRVN